MVKFKTLSMAIAGAACVTIGSAVAPGSAQAATITNNFRADVTTGSLAGQSFFGSFQYDDAALTDTSIQIIDPINGNQIINHSNGLLDLSFDILGTTYTEESDAGFPDFPQLNFQNGSFQFLDFLVFPPAVTDDSQRDLRFFQVGYNLDPTLDPLGSYFGAAFVSEPEVPFGLPFLGSQGSVTYGSSTAVPAPAVFPGVLAAGALGAVYRKRQSKKVSA